MTLREFRALSRAVAAEPAYAAQPLCDAVTQHASHAIAYVWRLPADTGTPVCVASAVGIDAAPGLQDLAKRVQAHISSGKSTVDWDEAGRATTVCEWDPTTLTLRALSSGAVPAILVFAAAAGTDARWYVTVVVESWAEAETLAAELHAPDADAVDPHDALLTMLDMSAGLVLLWEDTRIVYANAAALYILGYGRSELCNSAIQPLDLIHPRDRHRLHDTSLTAAHEVSDTNVLELTLQARDGTWIDVLASITDRVRDGRSVTLFNAIDIRDRVRLETELFTYTGHVGALQELLIEILELDLEPEELLGRLCRSLITIVSAEAVGAFLCDGDERVPSLITAHCAGRTGAAWHTALSAPADAISSALATALRHGQVVAKEFHQPGSVQPAEDAPRALPGAFLTIPLVQGRNAVGALVLGYGTPILDLTESQTQSLTLFAAQAALAVRKSLLIQRQHEQQVKNLQLLDATAALRGDHIVPGVYTRICQDALRLVPSGAVLLYLSEGNALVLKQHKEATVASGAWTPDTTAMDPAISQAFHTGAVVNQFPTTNGHSAARQSPGLSARGLLALPLVSQDRTVGVLAIANPAHGGAYTADDEQLMSTYVSHAAATLCGGMLLAEVTETKDYLEHLFESASDIIYTHDAEGQLLSINAVGRQLLGLSSRETPLPSLPDIVHPEDVAAALPDLAPPSGPAASEGPRTIRFRQADGGFRTVELATRVLEHHGRPVGVLGIGRDITGRQQLESQLRRTEKLTALGSLLASVAHELNNPLTGVLGFSELLLETTDPHVKAQAQHIHAEAQRCRAIVDSLLALHPASELDLEPIALAPLLDRTAGLVKYGFGLDNVTITTAYASTLPAVRAPADQLQRALLQVLQNAYEAIQSTGMSGAITLSATADADTVTIAVEDDGPGIDPEVSERLFDPFFTTRDGPGRGLGLSMVNNVLTAISGAIRIEPRHPHGTRVLLALPACTAEAETATAVAAPPEIDTHATTVPHARVLVVDDEEVIRELLSDLLGMLDFTVDVASDGRAGLDLIAEHDYAAVISDVKMPGMDGMQFFAELESRYPHLIPRLLFTSGDTIASDTKRFLEQAHRPYLSKPFTLSDLRTAVLDVIGAAHAAP